MAGGGFSMDDPAMDRYALSFVDASRPRVCFLPTAAADTSAYVMRFLEAFPSRSFEPTCLDLFWRVVGDVTSFLGEQDVIYVGGGNTANMLALWRLHGVDEALRAAWRSGVLCTGVSAGASCWFEACTTDSFARGRADPLLDGLGVLAGSFCPHYDSEPERRPRFLELVGSGALPEGLACDDPAAVRFEGTELAEAVATADGAAVRRVQRTAEGGVVEVPLEVRRIG